MLESSCPLQVLGHATMHEAREALEDNPRHPKPLNSSPETFKFPPSNPKPLHSKPFKPKP